jgi:hypothetical protein
MEMEFVKAMASWEREATRAIRHAAQQREERQWLDRAAATLRAARINPPPSAKDVPPSVIEFLKHLPIYR